MGVSKGLETIEYYDRLSESYDELYGDEQEAKYSLILERIAPRGIVLDLGCGTGLLFRKLSQLPDVKRIVGVDFSLGMLSKAKQRKCLQADLIAADIRLLPLRENSVDEAFSITVIDSLEFLRKCLSEIRGVLRGSRFTFSVCKAVKLSGEKARQTLREKGFSNLRLASEEEIKDVVYFATRNDS